MILVPDIHGRDFWKKIREKATEEKIIFLGDYIDPYPQERITDEQALENINIYAIFKFLAILNCVNETHLLINIVLV